MSSEEGKRPLPPLSSHLNAQGEAVMVDVAAKAVTHRTATARATVSASRDTLDRLRKGETPKGDVLAAARIAGIQGAKRTSDLIPLCHPIALTRVDVHIAIESERITIEARAEAHDRTGVEMEAMVAASTAALTLYDMLKGLDRTMGFAVELVEKTGGRSGTWQR